MFFSDTIAAVSTPAGAGAISIVRMSGNRAFEILNKIFVTKNGTFTDKQLVYGHIISNNTNLDEVLVSRMKAPNTYTREDIVEINCHGGAVVTRKILETVLENGARLANAGEFTERAFLNGRIDLSQAEAVMDIINAKTEEALYVAETQLSGKLSKEVKKITDALLKNIAALTAAIDFPEEDTPDITYEYLQTEINSHLEKMNALLKTFNSGKIIKDGIKTVIAGRPNVGKSSLLNLLLNEERAIVTDIEGTTRDTIEEYVTLGGVLLNIIDTAGIRDTEDKVEKIGVERSEKVMREADLVLLMLDGSSALTDDDLKILENSRDKYRIILLNKCDLPQKITPDDIKTENNDKIVKISIKSGEGIEKLKQLITEEINVGEIIRDQRALLTNIRQKDALMRAIKSAEDAKSAIQNKIPVDILENDFKISYDALGEITGNIINDDILDAVFQNFCVGK